MSARAACGPLSKWERCNVENASIQADPPAPSRRDHLRRQRYAAADTSNAALAGTSSEAERRCAVQTAFRSDTTRRSSRDVLVDRNVPENRPVTI